MDLATLNLDVLVSIVANIIIIVGTAWSFRRWPVRARFGWLVVSIGCAINITENLSGDFARRNIPVGALMVRCGLAYLMIAQVAMSRKKFNDKTSNNNGIVTFPDGGSTSSGARSDSSPDS